MNIKVEYSLYSQAKKKYLGVGWNTTSMFVSDAAIFNEKERALAFKQRINKENTILNEQRRNEDSPTDYKLVTITTTIEIEK